MTGTRYYLQTTGAADLEQQARYTRVRAIFIIIIIIIITNRRHADDTPAIIVDFFLSAIF